MDLERYGDLVCAAPNDVGARRRLEAAGVTIVGSKQSLTDPDDFADWAGSRKRLVMEDFYRDQRRRFGILIEDDGTPSGGRWNFDKDNRRPPEKGLEAPAPYRPLNAVEGFVRQVIGWREYVWGMYCLTCSGPATPTSTAWAMRWSTSASRATPTTSCG